MTEHKEQEIIYVFTLTKEHVQAVAREKGINPNKLDDDAYEMARQRVKAFAEKVFNWDGAISRALERWLKRKLKAGGINGA